MGREEILSYLCSGSWVSGEEMASKLGISRAAVWKQIKSLRARGYKIESSTNKGYRLVQRLDLLDADLIRSGLRTRLVGKDLRCYQEVGSTNKVASSIARTCKDGTVVLAEIQTEGRGRMSRSWSSPRGGVWMSLVLKPEIPLAQAYQINMAMCVAVSKTISGLYGLRTGIKWPNDILINDRKTCGILMEISAEIDHLDYAIVGIGINANINAENFPEEWRATSLSRELGFEVSRMELIQHLLIEIEEAYFKMGSQEIYFEWCKKSATLGKYVRVTSALGSIEGEAMSLSEDGVLCVRTSEGVMRVLAGDCIHLRAMPEEVRA